MPDMVLRLWDDSNNLLFDSKLAVGGVMADDIVATGGAAAQQKSYPKFPGRTVVLLNMPGFGSFYPDPTVDYALGYPRVSMPAVPAGYTGLVGLFVFVK